MKKKTVVLMMMVAISLITIAILTTQAASLPAAKTSEVDDADVIEATPAVEEVVPEEAGAWAI